MISLPRWWSSAVATAAYSGFFVDLLTEMIVTWRSSNRLRRTVGIAISTIGILLCGMTLTKMWWLSCS